MINWGPDEPIEESDSSEPASWMALVFYTAVVTALIGTLTGPLWFPVVQHLLGR